MISRMSTEHKDKTVTCCSLKYQIYQTQFRRAKAHWRGRNYPCMTKTRITTSSVIFVENKSSTSSAVKTIVEEVWECVAGYLLSPPSLRLHLWLILYFLHLSEPESKRLDWTDFRCGPTDKPVGASSSPAAQIRWPL